MNKKILIGVLVILFFSCKKENNKLYCWDIYSKTSGVLLSTNAQCGVSYNQLKPMFDEKLFLKSDVPKYCFKVIKPGSGAYVFNNYPQEVIDQILIPKGFTVVRSNCGTLCSVEWLITQTKKFNNATSQKIITETIDSPSDSCSKLVIDREIIIKDDIDSLVVKRVLKKS